VTRPAASIAVWAAVGLAACKRDRDRAPPADVPDAANDAVPTTALVGAADASARSASSRPLVPLSLDVESKKRDVTDVYGSSTRFKVLQDAFIVAGVGPGAYFDHAVDFVDRTLTAFYNGRFEKRPPYAVLLIFFRLYPDYASYVGKHFPVNPKDYYGIYGTYSHVAAVDGSGGLPYLPTLSHELAHAIIESADFPERPAWFGECVASLYEAPTFPAPGEIGGEPSWRDREVLRPALHPKNGGSAPDVRLDLLFGMDDDTFKATLPDGGTNAPVLAVHEATARAVCEWLDARGKLWPLYHAWRDHFADDPTGVASFTAVVGTAPQEATDAWRKWAERL
jgi:hypothetical protein